MPQFKCTKCSKLLLMKEFSHRGLCQNCELKRADGVEKEVREDLRVQSDRILQCEDVIVRLGPDLEAQARDISKLEEKTNSKMRIELAKVRSEFENLKLQGNVEKEKFKAEVEKARIKADLEKDKNKAEVEKEKHKAEAEKHKTEAEKHKTEAEKHKTEAQKHKAEVEKEKIKAEAEKDKNKTGLEKEKIKAEVEKERIKAEKEIKMLQMQINAGININTERTPANSNTNMQRARPQITAY